MATNQYNNLFGNILGNTQQNARTPITSQAQYNAYMQQMNAQRQAQMNAERQAQMNAQYNAQRQQYINQMNQRAQSNQALTNSQSNAQYLRDTAQKNMQTSMANTAEAIAGRQKQAEKARADALSNASDYTNMTNQDKALSLQGANKVAQAIMGQKSPDELQKGYDTLNSAVMRSAMNQNVPTDYLNSLLNPGEDISNYSYQQLMDVMMRTPKPKQVSEQTKTETSVAQPVTSTPVAQPVTSTPVAQTETKISDDIINRNNFASAYGLDPSKLPSDMSYTKLFDNIIFGNNMSDLKSKYGK